MWKIQDMRTHKDLNCGIWGWERCPFMMQDSKYENCSIKSVVEWNWWVNHSDKRRTRRKALSKPQKAQLITNFVSMTTLSIWVRNNLTNQWKLSNFWNYIDIATVICIWWLQTITKSYFLSKKCIDKKEIPVQCVTMSSLFCISHHPCNFQQVSNFCSLL